MFFPEEIIRRLKFVQINEHHAEKPGFYTLYNIDTFINTYFFANQNSCN